MRIEIPENNSGVSHIELDEAGNLKIIYKDGYTPKTYSNQLHSFTASPFTQQPHRPGTEYIQLYDPPYDETLSTRRIKECDCDTCRKERGELFRNRMYVCHVCGNKRCPKTENHRFKCTGSNDLNQIGELEDV